MNLDADYRAQLKQYYGCDDIYKYTRHKSEDAIWNTDYELYRSEIDREEIIYRSGVKNIKEAGVYVIKDDVNMICYVGESINIYNRVSSHTIYRRFPDLANTIITVEHILEPNKQVLKQYENDTISKYKSLGYTMLNINQVEVM